MRRQGCGGGESDPARTRLSARPRLRAGFDHGDSRERRRDVPEVHCSSPIVQNRRPIEKPQEESRCGKKEWSWLLRRHGIPMKAERSSGRSARPWGHAANPQSPTPAFKGVCATSLPDSQIVDALERRAADATDHGMTIAAHQRIRHRLGARGTVEFGCWLWHIPSKREVRADRDLPHPLSSYFAPSIFSTVIVFVLSSTVPVTVAFFPAYLAGAFWSLSM